MILNRLIRIHVWPWGLAGKFRDFDEYFVILYIHYIQLIDHTKHTLHTLKRPKSTYKAYFTYRLEPVHSRGAYWEIGGILSFVDCQRTELAAVWAHGKGHKSLASRSSFYAKYVGTFKVMRHRTV